MSGRPLPSSASEQTPQAVKGSAAAHIGEVDELVPADDLLGIQVEALEEVLHTTNEAKHRQLHSVAAATPVLFHSSWFPPDTSSS